jgi:hypothetical protein
MEEPILQLLYSVLASKGQDEIAKKVWKTQGSTTERCLQDLSLLERDANAVATRWIATAKLAIKGSKEHRDKLEQEAIKESGFDTK